jgi:hypothetical protein
MELFDGEGSVAAGGEPVVRVRMNDSVPMLGCCESGRAGVKNQRPEGYADAPGGVVRLHRLLRKLGRNTVPSSCRRQREEQL